MWLIFTRVDHGKEFETLINTDNVTNVKSAQNGCMFCMIGGEQIPVKESPPEVYKILKTAHNVTANQVEAAISPDVNIEDLAEKALKNHLKFPNTPFRQALKQIVKEVVEENKPKTEAAPAVVTHQHKRPAMTTAALG